MVCPCWVPRFQHSQGVRSDCCHLDSQVAEGNKRRLVLAEHPGPRGSRTQPLRQGLATALTRRAHPLIARPTFRPRRTWTRTSGFVPRMAIVDRPDACRPFPFRTSGKRAVSGFPDAPSLSRSFLTRTRVLVPKWTSFSGCGYQSMPSGRRGWIRDGEVPTARRRVVFRLPTAEDLARARKVFHCHGGELRQPYRRVRTTSSAPWGSC